MLSLRIVNNLGVFLPIVARLIPAAWLSASQVKHQSLKPPEETIVAPALSITRTANRLLQDCQAYTRNWETPATLVLTAN